MWVICTHIWWIYTRRNEFVWKWMSMGYLKIHFFQSQPNIIWLDLVVCIILIISIHIPILFQYYPILHSHQVETNLHAGQFCHFWNGWPSRCVVSHDQLQGKQDLDANVSHESYSHVFLNQGLQTTRFHGDYELTHRMGKSSSVSWDGKAGNGFHGSCWPLKWQAFYWRTPPAASPMWPHTCYPSWGRASNRNRKTIRNSSAMWLQTH